MLRLTILVIKIYQATNKLLLGCGIGTFPLYPSCNFYPSCSEYAVESLKKHGFKKGLTYSMGRIFRCHPWTSPRVDLP